MVAIYNSMKNNEDIRNKKILFSELALIMGIFLNGLAVVIYIESNFGISTISSIPFIMNKVFQGISLGNATIIFEILLLLILTLIVGMKKSYIYSILLGLLFGMIIDLYKWIFSFINIGKVNNIFLYIIAFACLSLGISLTLKSNLTALPFDLFVKDFSEKMDKPIKRVKTVFDITCVFIAISVSLLYFKEIRGVGIGTLISMLFTGNMIQIFSNILEKQFVFTPINKIKYNKSCNNK
ncbi:DUF6198 family protein [Tissierella sp.]|uniref:YczE/YyaS/YitT family protein n=1 Tax=Tissierella sp. TaxID=41274 RepID=UPI0028A7867C|nr:DUF6198 family protein [Tissierella sp.]